MGGVCGWVCVCVYLLRVIFVGMFEVVLGWRFLFLFPMCTCILSVCVCSHVRKCIADNGEERRDREIEETKRRRYMRGRDKKREERGREKERGKRERERDIYRERETHTQREREREEEIEIERNR